MDIGAEWILIYCDNIESNLKRAEEQEDKMTVTEKSTNEIEPQDLPF